MRNDTSFHLEWLRASAALAVFVGHFAYIGTNFADANKVWAFQRVGVIFFFVLSGYIIRTITSERNTSFKKYSEDRLARIISVYLPALGLTLLCDLLGRSLDSDLYHRFPSPGSIKFFLSIPFFFTFLFENSFFSLRWLSNGPAWSIAYEFWYYAIFGVTFLYKGRHKYLILAIVLFLTGWKILLLLPIWMIGVVIADISSESRKFREFKLPAPLLLIAIGTASIIIYCTPAGQSALQPLKAAGINMFPLGLHSYFLSDYILVIPVATLLLGVTTLPSHNIPGRIRKTANIFAGFSFSLYLFHLPIIVLLRSTHLYNPDSASQSALAAIGTIGICYLISIYTERKKSEWRTATRRAFEAILTFLRRKNDNRSRV